MISSNKKEKPSTALKLPCQVSSTMQIFTVVCQNSIFLPLSNEISDLIFLKKQHKDDRDSNHEVQKCSHQNCIMWVSESPSPWYHQQRFCLLVTKAVLEPRVQVRSLIPTNSELTSKASFSNRPCLTLKSQSSMGSQQTIKGNLNNILGKEQGLDTSLRTKRGM